MVNLIRMKLVNFIGVYYGTGLKEFEIDRANSPNNIILILGDNGSGKTSILNELTPLPLESMGARNRSRIIPNEIGIKELDFLVDNYVLYKVKIVYDPKKSTKCFITKYIDDKEIELNPNGNVESYLEVLENELHMRKSYTNVGYLCGGDKSKNFVSMKPFERSNYISEWMPEISEFLEAFKLSTKILNKLKREIENYNKQIGTMSSINFELELNFLNSNLTQLNKELERVNTKITQLNTYQDQIVTNVKTDKELEDLKLDLKTKTYSLNKLANSLIDEYQVLSTINISDPEEFQNNFKQIESDMKFMDNELLHLNEKLALLDSEIASSKTMLNTDSKISRLDLSTVFATIEANEEILKDIEASIAEYLDKYQDEELFMTVNEISDITTMLSIIDDKFIQLNNMISMDTIRDMDDVNNNIDLRNEELIGLNTHINDINNKLTFTNNEIYKYEHGNLDTDIIMKRPEFCKDQVCGVIDELLKYLNPKDNLQELYDTSKDLQSRLIELSGRKQEIEETLRNLHKSHQIYHEIGSFLYKNNEKVAVLPPLLLDLLSKTPSAIYTHMNEIKLILRDIGEYSSLVTKKEDLVKSIEDFNNIKSIVASNTQIEERIKKAIINYEDSKKAKTRLLENYFETKKLFETYSNAKEMFERRTNDFDNYNRYFNILSKYKEDILICAESSYIYNSNKNFIDNTLNKEKLNLETEIFELNKKRDEMTTFHISKKQIEKMRNEIQEEFNRINILNKVWSPKVGYPGWKIDSFLNDLTIHTNADLASMWGSELKIEEFKIDANEFSIVMNRDGNTINDASLCSQGETATINTAISFSIIESNVDNGGYDVLRLDEVDGTLDEKRRSGFIEMIQNRINSMGCDSCFIITHNGEFEDIPCDIILLNGAKVTEDKLKNKNVLFRY